MESGKAGDDTYVSLSPSTSSEYFSAEEGDATQYEGRSSTGDSFVLVSPPPTVDEGDVSLPVSPLMSSGNSPGPSTPFPEYQSLPTSPDYDDPMTSVVPPQPVIVKNASGQPTYQIPVPQRYPNDNVEKSTFVHAGVRRPTIDHESHRHFQPTNAPAVITEATLPLATALSVPVVAAPIVALGGELATATQALGSAVSDIKDIVNTAHEIVEHTSTNNNDEASPAQIAAGRNASPPLSGQLDDAVEALTLLAGLEGPTEPNQRRLTRRLRPESEASSFVKIGDNSIITTGITSELACDIPVSTQTPSYANFMRFFIPKLAAMADNFVIDVNAHTLSMQSILYSCEIGGRLGPGVEVHHPTFVTFDNPVASADRSTLTIHSGAARKLGAIDPSLLTPYMNGGVVSERFVVSAIQPKLGLANVAAARLLSEYLTSAVEYCDNYLMYAKLLYQALVLDVVTSLGLDIAVDAFPAGNDPTFVNLDDPNLLYTTISTPIVRGDIIFVDRIDYTPDDLQVIMWLAKEGTRASAAGNAHIPQCCYVSWPAIPVTVLVHGAPPAMPVAADLTANSIFSFVSRLATSRGEWGAALRGFYLALDQLGVTYEHDARDGGRWHFLTPYLTFHSPIIPRVQDYNVLLRILQIKPTIDMDAQEELSAAMACTPDNRARLYALYNQSTTAIASTIVYDFNLTCTHLIQWGTGAGAMPAAARAVVQNYSQANVHSMRESNFLTQLKNLFPVYYGCAVPSQLYPSSDWLGTFGGSANCDIAFIGLQLHQPPKLGNPLVVDNWLLVRPMEWGVSGPNTSLDLAKEIIDVGAPAARGWRSVRGSEKYAERAASSCPVKITIYGIQVLNAINNEFRWQVDHHPFFSAANWSPGLGVEWNPPVAMPDWTPNIIDALHTYEPCSIMSYRYDVDQVLAPALVGPQALNAPALRRLFNWRGGDQPQVGFYASTAMEIAPQASFIANMNLSSMFGHMTVAAPPDSEASTPSPSNPP